MATGAPFPSLPTPPLEQACRTRRSLPSVALASAVSRRFRARRPGLQAAVRVHEHAGRRRRRRRLGFLGHAQGLRQRRRDHRLRGADRDASGRDDERRRLVPARQPRRRLRQLEAPAPGSACIPRTCAAMRFDADGSLAGSSEVARSFALASDATTLSSHGRRADHRPVGPGAAGRCAAPRRRAGSSDRRTSLAEGSPSSSAPSSDHGLRHGIRARGCR